MRSTVAAVSSCLSAGGQCSGAALDFSGAMQNAMTVQTQHAYQSSKLLIFMYRQEISAAGAVTTASPTHIC